MTEDNATQATSSLIPLMTLEEKITRLGGAQYVLDQIASGEGMKALAARLSCTAYTFAKWRDANLNPEDLALAVQVHYDGLAEEGLTGIRTADTTDDIKRGQLLVKAAIDVGQFNSSKYRITKEKAETVIHLNADLASMYALPQGTTINQLPEKLINNARP